MTSSSDSPQSASDSDPGQDAEERHFGFKPVSEGESGVESAGFKELAFDELLIDEPATRPNLDSAPLEMIEPGQVPKVFERPELSLERSWILALALGFVGTLVGGLTGIPGAPLLLGVAGVAPVWLRAIGGANTPSAALAAMAWTLGCFGAGAGLGAEGAAERFEAAVPLARHYLAFLPLLGENGSDSLLHWPWHWPSLIPGACFLVAISVLGRAYRGLGALLLAGLPVTWIAARSARFTALALQDDWDAASALLVSVPPQHFLVLVGALAVAVASASPLAGRGLVPSGGPGRKVFWAGAGAALIGLLGEPLLAEVWRSYSAI